jgi:nicotinamidase-related amidase
MMDEHVLGKDSALLLVDVITDFNFEDGDKLFAQTKSMVPRLEEFHGRFHRAGLPVFYVNDPPKSRSRSVDALLEEVSSSDRGKFMLDAIGPSDRSLVITKPQRSGFFETDLEERLREVGAKRVFVTGVTTDICVLFTAHDAYMRKFSVCVPSDCSTAVEPEYHEEALRFLARVADVDVSPAVERIAPGEI